MAVANEFCVCISPVESLSISDRSQSSFWEVVDELSDSVESEKSSSEAILGRVNYGVARLIEW